MITEDWFVGFSDGEAWFTIQMASGKLRRLGFNVTCIFRIQLAKQDLDMLYRIKEFLGYGYIWIDNRGWGTYIISSKADAIKIRALFNAHPLLTEKHKAFTIWSQALDLIIQKKHLTPEGLLELAVLRDNMNQNPKRASCKGYRNVDYFKDRLQAITNQPIIPAPLKSKLL